MEQQQFQTTVLEILRSLQEQITDIRHEMRDMRHDIRRIDENVHEIQQSSNVVKIKFSWMWGVVSLLIAIFASGLTQIFVK